MGSEMCIRDSRRNEDKHGHFIRQSYQGKPDMLHMIASQLILDAAEIIMAEAEV